ncbi:magnesium transporter [Thiocapsa imhoffii]|uniref:Magnesium transporter MgtE n=1 Tax=Thiocapsa imhoffii TaxID=382777 RepID=A0A9X0WJT9_9GAMM|nr:magnesium transporter [Thiocapsa imhoffii]MBK1645836.1 magnesium transporter [Thiocapsa imhoffii]
MTSDDLRQAAHGDADALTRLSLALKGKGNDLVELAEAAAALEPAETARLILGLRPRRARVLLTLLDDTPSLRVLQALDPSVSDVLLDRDQQARIAKIVAKLPVEEAADFLAESPRDLVEVTLEALGQPIDLVRALDHRNETAGALMRRRLVAAPLDWTIAQVIDKIREQSDRIDRLYAVYAIDSERRLHGYLKIRDLLLLAPETQVGDVMHRDTIMVSAGMDRAEVARIADRAQLPVLPVVDSELRLLGRVTTDELRAIDRAEAEEDMKLMSGLAPDSSAADGPLRIVPRRLPWLAAGLIGSGTAAFVVGSYEDALAKAAILASLIPIVMSMAGNAGIQASTVTVQAQASGGFWIGDLGGRILREIGGALLNGLIVGILVALAIVGIGEFIPIERPFDLGLTAGLTLVAVTTQAATIGALIPVLLERLGFDPAVATGVFITTSNDVMGVLIFFLIATAVYL